MHSRRLDFGKSWFVLAAVLLFSASLRAPVFGCSRNAVGGEARGGALPVPGVSVSVHSYSNCGSEAHKRGIRLWK